MKDEDFSLNLVLKYVRLSYIHIWGGELYCTKSDHSELDHVEPNSGLPHHIAMHDLHSSGILCSVEW